MRSSSPTRSSRTRSGNQHLKPQRSPIVRSVFLWLTSALMALVSAGLAVSQPPLPKDGGSQRGGDPARSGADFVIRDDRGPRRLGADDVVARLLSFDKSKDGQ